MCRGPRLVLGVAAFPAAKRLSWVVPSETEAKHLACRIVEHMLSRTRCVSILDHSYSCSSAAAVPLLYLAGLLRYAAVCANQRTETGTGVIARITLSQDGTRSALVSSCLGVDVFAS